MPSASTALCAQCETNASKYTCPTCKTRTCSLVCSKAHKDPAAAKNVCSANASTAAPASSSSALVAPVRAMASQDRDASNVPAQYIPLAQYGESHMLQDYLFLSSISRTTAENGRRIMSLNLMPPSTASDTVQKPHASCSTHTANGSGARLTNQQRQREQLIKQLHYRRFKVMVLPEGMARRKSNMSHFNPKQKSMNLTVEIKLPTHLSHTQTHTSDAEPIQRVEGSWLLHRQDSNQTVQQVVLAELQHRSFPNKKDLANARQTVSSSKGGGRMWLVALSVIAEVGLVVPGGAEMEDGRVLLPVFPKEWAVVVPAYSARLSNESTTRYLDWWARKRKWHEANPELAAEQKALEQRGEVRHSRMRSGDEADVRNTSEPRQEPPSPQAVAPIPEVKNAALAEAIVSSSLLSLLSQRLGRNQSSPSHESPSNPTPLVSPATPRQMEVQSDPNARSILIHTISPSSTTLSWLLQNLPDGYSVVEFPELRVLPSAQIGSQTVIPLSPPPSNQQNAESNGQQVRKAETSTVTVVTSGSLGGLLAAYDSDSDSDSEVQAKKVEEEMGSKDLPQENDDDDASLARLASIHGFVRSASSS